MIDIFPAIETRHGIAVPALYRTLAAEGRLAPFGERDPRTLRRSRRVALLYRRARAGQYLYLPQVEWYPPQDLLEFVPGTFAPGLLPFAGNGFGDHWCWYRPWATSDQAPVVFYEHDGWVATGVAPAFDAAVFRLLLEAAVEFADADFPAAGLGPLLATYAGVLAPHLPAAWIAVLRELSARPPTPTADGYASLLPRAEAEQLITTHLAFPRLGAAFRAAPGPA